MTQDEFNRELDLCAESAENVAERLFALADGMDEDKLRELGANKLLLLSAGGNARGVASGLRNQGWRPHHQR